MADQFESIQTLQREVTAARQAFDHAHFSSTSHQEQVVSNAKHLIPAAAAACVAQGASQAATQILQGQVHQHVGIAAGVTWAEVNHFALEQVRQPNNVTGYVPLSDIQEQEQGTAVSSPWVPAGSEFSVAGHNKASNKKNGLVLGTIALVAILVLSGATYGIVHLLDKSEAPNSATTQNGSSSKTDPTPTPNPKQPTGPSSTGTRPAVPQDAAGDVLEWGTKLRLSNATLRPLLPGNPDYYAPAWIPELTDVQDIALGYNTGYALLNDGTVKAWGSNNNGMLGVSGDDHDRSLVHIDGLAKVVQVLSQSETTYALLEDGTVMAWGANDKGQLGTGANVYRSNVPVQVADLESAVSVAAGYNSAFAVLEDGTVKGWGDNYFSQPGGVHGDVPFHEVPVVVEGLKAVQTVVSGWRTLFGILNDGTVKVVGSKEYGVAGDGEDDWDFATAQSIPNVSNVKDLIVGRKAVIALLTDGTVMSWGTNDYGLLGQGSKKEDQIKKPQFIEELSGVHGVVLGYDTAHATLTDGTVLSWGAKASMNATTKSYDELVTKPENISGLTGARTMYAGDAGFYALVPKN